MTATDTVLEVTGLRKYFGRTRALDGVSLDVQAGTILGLLGPNGSGKSTLLKIAAGLQHPTGGRIKVMGRPPGVASKRLTAYLSEVDSLYAWWTVREAMTFTAAFFEDWDEARARDLLGFLNLDPALPVTSLSKGMKARLKLVLAMGRKAPLVLLDEPLSGIDPPSRSRIVKALISTYRQGEQAIVISTHEVAETEGIYDRVVFLDRGRVGLAGEADALRQEHGKSIEELFEEVFP